MHGLYKPGAVKLRPWLLGKHQKYVKAKLQNSNGDIPGAIVPDEPDDMNPEEVDTNEDPETKNPVFLVFHGGSGSAKEEFLTGIQHGVVKVNIDTDTQFTYTKPVRDWMVTHADRLESPVGTKADPNDTQPNKGKFDPRKWLREAEVSMSNRVQQALREFNAAGKWTVQRVTLEKYAEFMRERANLMEKRAKLAEERVKLAGERAKLTMEPRAKLARERADLIKKRAKLAEERA